MNGRQNALTHAARLGSAVTDALVRTGYCGGSESPESLGRRIAFIAATESLDKRPDAGVQVRSAFADAAERLQLSVSEAGALLGMEGSDYREWLRDTEPKSNRSYEQIVDVAITLNLVESVLGSTAGRNWLYRPSRALKLIKPAQLLESGSAAQVSNLVDEIRNR